MFTGQLAVISDVHGNRWALDAVLADIECRGIRHIVNLGDSLYGPLDPGRTAEILLPLGLPTVCGNEDRLILTGSGESGPSPTLHHVRKALRSDQLRWLEGLPMTQVAHGAFYMCHGTPQRDDEYLLHEVVRTGVVRRPAESVRAKVASIPQSVLLCGHDHLPGTAWVSEKALIVNPGSVGLPAFADDVPFAHVMAAGSPHARYSVVTAVTPITGDGPVWHVENITVPYDWFAASTTARANNRPDWAEWLLTGCAVHS